jgi:hypothetical protein
MGVAGIAREAKLMSVRIFAGGVTTDAWAVINGVAYNLNIGENDIMELGDVAEFAAVRRA